MWSWSPESLAIQPFKSLVLRSGSRKSENSTFELVLYCGQIPGHLAILLSVVLYNVLLLNRGCVLQSKSRMFGNATFSRFMLRLTRKPGKSTFESVAYCSLAVKFQEAWQYS